MAPPRNRLSRRAVIASLAAAPVVLRAPALCAAPGPDTFVLAFHVTISPAWFDPSAAPPQHHLPVRILAMYPGFRRGKL